jgi:ankyrin repeat protein
MITMGRLIKSFSCRIVFSILATAMISTLAEAGKIHDAAATGDLRAVKRVLNEQPSALESVEQGVTPLQIAVLQRQLEVAQLLISKGAKYDVFSASGLGQLDRLKELLKENPQSATNQLLSGTYLMTPLVFAAGGGHITVAEFLLANGAKMESSSNGDAALLIAVLNGHRDMVAFLLRHGANPNAADHRITALRLATEHGLKEIAELLVRAGANLNTQSDAGLSPLHWAIIRKHADIAEMLIKKGADVNLHSDEGNDALRLALGNRVREIVPLLLASGAKLDIFTAAGVGDLELVKRLVHQNPSLLQAREGPPNRPGFTPLHMAAYCGQTRVVEFLLANGVKVDCLDGEGRTPLAVAVPSGGYEVVKLLLSHGAKVNAELYHSTPLMNAASSGDRRLTELLIAKGANVDEGGGNNNPLSLAAKYGHGEIAVLLLDKGASINPTNVSEWTPLLMASAAGHAEIVELLLKRGAKPNFDPNPPGQPPLHAAARTGNPKIVRMLIESGANVNRLYEGYALHATLKRFWQKPGTYNEEDDVSRRKLVIELLLSAGADVNSLDVEGRTPLRLARELGETELAKFLAEHGGRE